MPDTRYRRFVEILSSARMALSKQQLSERLDGTHVRTISRYLNRLEGESAQLERGLTAKLPPSNYVAAFSFRASGLIAPACARLD